MTDEGRDCNDGEIIGNGEGLGLVCVVDGGSDNDCGRGCLGNRFCRETIAVSSSTAKAEEYSRSLAVQKKFCEEVVRTQSKNHRATGQDFVRGTLLGDAQSHERIVEGGDVASISEIFILVGVLSGDLGAGSGGRLPIVGGHEFYKAGDGLAQGDD